MKIDSRMESLLSRLSNKKTPYAIITGAFDEEGAFYEQSHGSLTPDLDVIFFDLSRQKVHEAMIEAGAKYLEYNTYVYDSGKHPLLPIDIYINYINVGYYRLFQVDKKRVTEQGGYKVIGESDYILYQILDPIVKFSEYKPRHRFRLKKFIQEGHITPDIENRLSNITGTFIASYILEIIKNDDIIDKRIVNLLKLRLLTQNGNLLRMIQERFL